MTGSSLGTAVYVWVIRELSRAMSFWAYSSSLPVCTNPSPGRWLLYQGRIFSPYCCRLLPVWLLVDASAVAVAFSFLKAVMASSAAGPRQWSPR
jgi:hypothetical protein